MRDACFHCGDPLPAGEEWLARVGGRERAVCCPGCRAVAEFIDANGMAAFYLHRDAPPPDADLKPADEAYRRFDGDEFRQRYLHVTDGDAEAVLEIGNMYCSACAWLLERTLARHAAVRRIDINPATRRAVVRWDLAALPFGRLLETIARAGFRPLPLGADRAGEADDAEYRTALKRLIVAAAAGMQVMMFAIALYAGERFGIDGAIEKFLRGVSLLVSLPIVFYAARPFFAAAWRGLRARAPGMDLPVSLAIGAAFGASVFAVWRDSGAVYFDSVAMFVLFLSGTRFLEMRARHRAGDQALALSRLVPDFCTRVRADGADETLSVMKLEAGDVLRIRPGDVLPADGRIVDGCLEVDESLLTGESEPVGRPAGSPVCAGGTAVAGSARVRVTRVGSDTSLAEIGRLLERAKADRPPVAMLADRIAAAFVSGVLLLAALTGAFWLRHDADRAFEVVLATLVVTCPCALALATPAALAAAASRLAEQGAFLVRARLLAVFRPGATVVFDKTGTLTRGEPEVLATRRLAAAGSRAETDCLALAAAVEASSEHVLARAFAPWREAAGHIAARAAEVATGQGAAAVVDGLRYRVGSAAWVAELAGPAPAPMRGSDGTLVYLGSEQGFLAEFRIGDELREDAAAAVTGLRATGFRVVIASGDRRAAVERVAKRLGVEEWHAELTPADKLALIAAERQAGETVIMVGDGVNDAPVLEAADASLAMDAGTALARASADAIALSRRLVSVCEVAAVAAATRRVIRQNVAWAIAYNLTAVPLAASGLLAPWMAALGMSASSLLVVLNALRLRRAREPRASGASQLPRSAEQAVPS